MTYKDSAFGILNRMSLAVFYFKTKWSISRVQNTQLRWIRILLQLWFKVLTHFKETIVLLRYKNSISHQINVLINFLHRFSQSLFIQTGKFLYFHCRALVSKGQSTLLVRCSLKKMRILKAKSFSISLFVLLCCNIS